MRRPAQRAPQARSNHETPESSSPSALLVIAETDEEGEVRIIARQIEQPIATLVMALRGQPTPAMRLLCAGA